MSPIDIMLISFASAILLLVLGYLTTGLVVFIIITTRQKKRIPSNNTDALMGSNHAEFSQYMSEKYDKLQEIPCEQVTVKSDAGFSLAGYYYAAEKPTPRTVLCVHGYNSTGMGDFAAISEYYLKRNYNMLLIDNRAHGKSGGKIIGFGVLDKFDILKWIKFLKDRNPDVKILLHGISMGAAAVLMTTGTDLADNVQAAVADCGYTRPWDVFSIQIRHLFRIPPFPILNLMNLNCNMFAGYSFKTSTVPACSRSKTPTLFIHGSEDKFVPSFMSKVNYDACAAKKQLVIIEGADHAGSYFKDSITYSGALDGFLSKYFN